ncbi:MAG: hypothetical protein OXU20_28885 [Myxococcales bacterium]|nr:hypothetical protein [Myxococcales bacterium]
MSERKKYRRKPGTTVVAVQLALETEGFTFEKWGGRQHCKQGDWIVDSDGEVHTVDAEVFNKTYQQVSRGVYEKVGTVWAERAEAKGAIPTKEGASAYEPGDMLVFNDAEGTDGYAVSASKFASLYEPIDS